MNKQIEALRALTKCDAGGYVSNWATAARLLIAAYDASGWRDDAPTAAEVEAHAHVDDEGIWLRWDNRGVSPQSIVVANEGRAFSAMEIKPGTLACFGDDGYAYPARLHGKWRPATSTYDRAPWPEVKP